jgi:glycosyltransferase involved in cell wall biosynthesis
MATVGRNSACPCGSGERYKDCHGALAPGVATPRRPAQVPGISADPLHEAAERLEAGDLTFAEQRCRDALELTPDHPEALRLLGRCAFERGESADALLNLIAAARSMQVIPLSPSGQYAVWTDLNFMFTQALSGMDSDFSVSKRIAYGTWQAGLLEQQSGGMPLVSIILVSLGSTSWMREALRSVYAQTYPRVELIVVSADADPNASAGIEDMLQDCPFPHRVLALPGLKEASLINVGVRASTGEFVNVLDARDRLSETRVAAMVRDVAGRGLSWGFSKVDFIADADHVIDTEHDSAISGRTEPLRRIEEADTIGYSLIDQVFVAVAVGNLFFSRQLFDFVGGFRDLAHFYAWDFSLRAVWFDEPAFVPTAEYRRRIAANGDESTLLRQEQEVAQIAMFTEFYAKAGDGTAPRNPYAPSLHNWRMQFLKKSFQVGHVLAFPLERLEALAGQVAKRRMATAGTAALPGVNLVGFAFGEFGLAENLRALAKACLLGEIPFVVRDVDMRLKTRQADRTLGPYIADELRHACSVFCLNPDMLKPVRHLLKSGTAMPRYNIGFWFWELERIPREWLYAIDAVDEIWVATEFVRDAMRSVTSKPVTKVPTPIEVNLSRSYTRAEFALPEDRFLFLFSFDFNSFVMRKNPEGAIAAFKSAFADARQDVGLVIKSINGANRPDKLREIQELVGGDERIIITDEFLSRDQVFGLESVVDAYVSLHRAEGLGLGLAESMYLGKPVIGTAYSGNLEFMDADNSCLVDYRLVPIRKGEYLYDDERFRWAEPDLAQASHWMARLADDVEFRTRIAQRGQHDIRSRFTHANAAALMRGRLTELGLL